MDNDVATIYIVEMCDDTTNTRENKYITDDSHDAINNAHQLVKHLNQKEKSKWIQELGSSWNEVNGSRYIQIGAYNFK